LGIVLYGEYGMMEVMSKFDENKLEELLTDGLHPSTAGHKIIYEEVKVLKNL